MRHRVYPDRTTGRVQERWLSENAGGGSKVQSGPVTAGRKEETGTKAEEAYSVKRRRWNEVQRKEESERKQVQLLL